jgi:hypothetical protein
MHAPVLSWVHASVLSLVLSLVLLRCRGASLTLFSRGIVDSYLGLVEGRALWVRRAGSMVRSPMMTAVSVSMIVS